MTPLQEDVKRLVNTALATLPPDTRQEDGRPKTDSDVIRVHLDDIADVFENPLYPHYLDPKEQPRILMQRTTMAIWYIGRTVSPILLALERRIARY